MECGATKSRTEGAARADLFDEEPCGKVERSETAARQPIIKNPGAKHYERKYQIFPNAKRETATRQKTNSFGF